MVLIHEKMSHNLMPLNIIEVHRVTKSPHIQLCQSLLERGLLGVVLVPFYWLYFGTAAGRDRMY